MLDVRCLVPQVVAGQTAALALKKVKRSSLRKVGHTSPA